MLLLTKPHTHCKVIHSIITRKIILARRYLLIYFVCCFFKLLVSEVNLLSELQHPNIVQYFDRIIHKETATLYIIMEWCKGGDLATLINKCKK